MMGCSHPCNGHINNNNNAGGTASTNAPHLSASMCREQACKGHKLVNGSSLCQQAACEGDDVEDEDSGSERSSCASSSTNQRDGKYCDCCYCEFFGHNAPPAAPTSRNYAEIREKLRSRLTRRKEEVPQRQDLDPALTCPIDHRDVDELLHFINSTEPKRVNSAKAAKRARHKQKKKEKERAQQTCSEQRLSSSPQPEAMEEMEEEEEEEEEHAPDGEAGRLLEWPQLELERVNSFLTSRLEEIKNTIKDSIRASFSMYDLNLDVSDFPKKAASLEGQRLLPHINGSATEPQQIDLDLAPLSFKNFKKSVKILQGLTSENNNSSPPPTEPTTPIPTNNNNTTVNAVPAPSDAPKSKEETKNVTGNAAKTKKGKKNQRQEQASQEQQTNSKPAKATSGNQEKSNEAEKGVKGGCRGAQQHGESQRTASKKVEENKPASKHNGNNAASNGNHHAGSNTQRGKNDNDTRSSKSEHEADGKSSSNNVLSSQHQQQSKGKNKKNKSKTEKSSPAIDDVFLPKDLDPTEMDEIDREVEYFKRFCLDSAKQTRQKVAVNWSNFSLKKMPSNAAQ